jgi:hypothetical protein
MKPSDWLERGRSQLTKSGEYAQWIDIVPRKVVEVKSVASSAGQTRFSLRDEKGDDWHSRKIILANGVTDELPDIQGGSKPEAADSRLPRTLGKVNRALRLLSRSRTMSGPEPSPRCSHDGRSSSQRHANALSRQLSQVRACGLFSR